MAAAIAALEEGLDFAHALHVMSARRAGATAGFTSFDTRLLKRARKRWPDAILVNP